MWKNSFPCIKTLPISAIVENWEARETSAHQSSEYHDLSETNHSQSSLQ